MKPITLSYPVVKHRSGQRCVLLQMAAINDVRPDHSPTNCNVVGLLESGRIVHFVMSLSDWNHARISCSVHFAEVNTLRGPEAVLVKPAMDSVGEVTR